MPIHLPAPSLWPHGALARTWPAHQLVSLGHCHHPYRQGPRLGPSLGRSLLLTSPCPSEECAKAGYRQKALLGACSRRIGGQGGKVGRPGAASPQHDTGSSGGC